MGLTENGGLSVADALALQDRGASNDQLFGGNSAWVFFLFFLLAWGNGGFGGMGNNAMQGALTRADLTAGLNQQDNSRNQAGIMNEIGEFERAATGTWGNMRYDNLMGVNSINNNINQARFDDAKCCWTFAAA